MRDVYLELANIIQNGKDYPESYALMLSTFCDALQEGETEAMALALAKKAIED